LTLKAVWGGAEVVSGFDFAFVFFVFQVGLLFVVLQSGTVVFFN
jgi:hypothetical protein